MVASFDFEFSELGKLGEAVAKAKRVVDDKVGPARDAGQYLLGRVQNVFITQTFIERWPALSPLTKFIRAHRRSAPHRTALPLRDKGRLFGSLVNFVGGNGDGFGVSTNVSYAQRMNSGGKSESNQVQIGAFSRRRPGMIPADVADEFSMARRRNGVVVRTNMVRVRPYTMNVKGGHDIPPRPFMPTGAEQLDRLGWLAAVKGIFVRHIDKGMAA